MSDNQILLEYSKFLISAIGVIIISWALYIQIRNANRAKAETNKLQSEANDIKIKAYATQEADHKHFREDNHKFQTDVLRKLDKLNDTVEHLGNGFAVQGNQILTLFKMVDKIQSGDYCKNFQHK